MVQSHFLPVQPIVDPDIADVLRCCASGAYGDGIGLAKQIAVADISAGLEAFEAIKCAALADSMPDFAARALVEELKLVNRIQRGTRQ